MADKKARKEVEKKSLLKRIMTFGARDKASKSKREGYLSKQKQRKFQKAYRNR